MISIPRSSVLRPHATIIISDPDRPNEIHMDVLSCVHCQMCWVVQIGSGRQRGYCSRCAGVTCGSKACCNCDGPMERRLELYEAGKIASL
jgi:hypothetical protein